MMRLPAGAMIAATVMMVAPASAQMSLPPPPSVAIAAPAGVEAASQNVTIRLLSDRSAVAPGSTFHLAIRQTIAPGWHTYWRNSGDSGDATRIDWTLPPGASAGPIAWPTPQALPFGPLVNYGYSNAVTLTSPITLPSDAAVGARLRFTAQVSWLECADVCIPADAMVSIELPVAATATPSPDAAELAAVAARLPQRLPQTGAMSRDAQGLAISVPLPAFAGVRQAMFFPHELPGGALIDHAAPQRLETGPGGLTLRMPASPSLPEAWPEATAGVLVTGTGDTAEAFEIALAPADAPPAGTFGRAMAAPASPGALGDVARAVLFAFLGGLILNLMPCVFPILAMKALGLAEAAHGSRREARVHGLAYGAGVLMTFVGLAGVLIGLQAAGSAVGWGFQLQSPPVLVVLATLMALIGFSLMGWVEVGGTLQSAGSDLAARGGATGSFMTGILAVVVASPCTAPFMGAALGFAATQPPAISLSVFAALGVGFAAPFVVLSLWPGLSRALPRPGPWMARFREAMAFPMFATAAWLVWVLVAQAGQTGALAALAAIIAAGFAVWLGRAVSGPVGRLAALGVGAGALVAAAFAAHAAPSPAAAGAPAAGALAAQPWSPQREAELLAQGRPVFVNFTADWCVTCKVNEAVVFNNAAVSDAFAAKGVAYLIADWTSRDIVIAQTLSSYGRLGVPLYVFHGQGAAEPVVLPQILTPDLVVATVSGGEAR